jgi:molecular chaperone DnaK (HSP70)
MSKYLIGIDLGTTNSALACIETRSKGEPRIEAFRIPQLTAPGEVADRMLLPSFLYLPGPHDLPPQACSLPWDAARNFAVGEFARNHGAKVPGRLVSSAKSWLCHAGVDRTAALLPWSAPPDVPRLSPVETSARYLRHMAEAWNHVIAKDRTQARFENQEIVLTVPASFDDVARNLTVDAARKAGIEHLTLLEEPQAAFYCWLAIQSGKEQRTKHKEPSIKPGMTCVVVDVGGGTSDFSLIQAIEQEGEMVFVRQAVGDHLLLGGDNMDLTLARHVEIKLPPHPTLSPAAGEGRVRGSKLDVAGFGMLTQACRLAKETLLAPNPPAEHTVTVVGRGRSVVGGTLFTTLTPDEIRKILFDGFFPFTAFDDEPVRGGKLGLHEMGLPYVSDPAVTKHLSAFLRQHEFTAERPPDTILFNGGVFQPESLRERLLAVMHRWYDRPKKPWQPLVLTTPSLDLAVAWGAAYYGWLRHTGGRRISGGLARSYYIGIQPADSGLGTQDSGLTLLCVVPKHLEEGEEIELAKPELELALGQPVTFPLYTSTVRGNDKPGDVLQVAPKQLLRLPPLHTILRGGKRSGTKSAPVKLAARLTPIGTLELWCVAKNSDNRWRLEFNTREIVKDDKSGEAAGTASAASGGMPAVTDIWPEDKVQLAADGIRRVYADPAEQPARELTRSLENALEASRERWPTGLCRRLWEFLDEVADQRRRSPAHLGRWYNLAGYCLRPGFGDPLDKFRVDQLWKILHSTTRLPGQTATAQRGIEGGADYWIMWRRVAGGLHVALQQSLLDRLRPMLLPAKGGKGAPVKPGANEFAEMWRAVAGFERLDVKHKEALGQVLLKQARRSPVPPYAFWALTRLGARVLLYGPLNTVVHPEIVGAWLEQLFHFHPGNDSERRGWQFCLAQLARKTDQRALEIGEDLRHRAALALRTANAPDRLVRLVEEGGALESAEENQMFGDALPIGLRLVATEQGADAASTVLP